MKTNLFAALDSSGAMRFIGEVERGAACGCFCPVCESPLIARQGELKEWHFAHEALQERPECEVGALNMLRRVATEMLQRGQLPVLPLYNQEVTFRSTVGLLHEIVSWAAEIVPEGLTWEARGLQSIPFLRGKLTTGVPFSAHVVVREQRQQTQHLNDQDTAQLVYEIALPTQADFRSRIKLEQHIRDCSQWRWLHHPDHLSQISASKSRLRIQAELAEIKLQQEWAKAQEAQQHQESMKALELEAWEAQQKAKTANRPDDSVPWAPQRKPQSSFTLYKLRHGQGSWVIYTRLDESRWIVPLPLFDGWDEALPPSVGTPDKDAFAYRVGDLTKAMIHLARNQESLRASSSVYEIEEFAGLH